MATVDFYCSNVFLSCLHQFVCYADSLHQQIDQQSLCVPHFTAGLVRLDPILLSHPQLRTSEKDMQMIVVFSPQARIPVEQQSIVHQSHLFQSADIQGCG